MIKSFSVLPVVLVFATRSFICLSQQLTCQSNGYDSCRTTSDFCSTEHTFVSEDKECGSLLVPLPLETPLIPGLQLCPFDFHTYEYGACPNFHVDDRNQLETMENLIELEQNIFSMTIMWEHTNAVLLPSLPDLNPDTRLEYMKRKPGALKLSDNALCHRSKYEEYQ